MTTLKTPHAVTRPLPLVAVLACAALPLAAGVRAHAAGVEHVSAEVGSDPLYCAQVAPDRKLCTWHEGRSHHRVCEFDAEATRTSTPCLRLADNENMHTYPTSPGKKRVRADRVRAEAREAARARLAAARSLDDVVALIGAGPVWCRRGANLTCAWHAVRRTPGYIAASRAADAPGKKIGVVCRFAADGSARPDSCSAEAAGRIPQPRP